MQYIYIQQPEVPYISSLNHMQCTCNTNWSSRQRNKHVWYQKKMFGRLLIWTPQLIFPPLSSIALCKWQKCPYSQRFKGTIKSLTPMSSLYVIKRVFGFLRTHLYSQTMSKPPSLQTKQQSSAISSFFLLFFFAILLEPTTLQIPRLIQNQPNSLNPKSFSETLSNGTEISDTYTHPVSLYIYMIKLN